MVCFQMRCAWSLAISGCEFEAASQKGQIAELYTAASSCRRTRRHRLQLCISRAWTSAPTITIAVSIFAASIVLALLCTFTRVAYRQLLEHWWSDGRRRAAVPHMPRCHFEHAV